MNTILRTMIAILAAVLLWTAPVRAGTLDTSNSTVNDILSDIQGYVNDSTSEFVSESQYIDWINEAVVVLTMEARCMEGSANATIYSGQMDYDVGSSFMDIETVLYDSGEDNAQRYTVLDKIDPKDLVNDDRGSIGRPAKWFQWGERLHLWPIPGDDQNATVIMVFGLTKPDALTATTDAVPTPYYFDNAIALYVAGKYYEKDERENKAAYYRNLFHSEVERYRAKMREKPAGAAQ